VAQSLVIVESPAKASTINRYLGKDYVVKSSVGHVRDLKKRGMGLEPENGWKAHYEVDPDKKKVISDLKRTASKSDSVYLATDLDREGEAIAWHLREIIGGDLNRFKRVIFSEITQKAIREAFAHPTELNMDRVNAQQARRFLDRVVGFELSPLLWQRIARGLSAGRVQSVAVRMIVEREREIREFVPVAYWQIHAGLKRGKDGPHAFQVVGADGKKAERFDEGEAKSLVERLTAAGRIESLKRTERKSMNRPAPPLITSTLQREATTRLGYGIARTMRLAQQLYEAGVITYMRTDSTNLSGDAVSACREHIKRAYGDKYLPAKPRVYSSRASAQEAHEAIRPTDVNKLPASVSLGKDTAQARRVYELIWRRFVACQMSDALTLSVSLLAEADGVQLKRTGTSLLFDGFGRVAPKNNKEEVKMPDWQGFARGEAPQDAATAIQIQEDIKSEQKFTKPKPRYTEAGLVRELEKHGIGRPSTYASIIQTIQARGYVRLEGKAFWAEPIGEVVTDRLKDCFPKLMDYGFTSDLEGDLDEIALGKRDWLNVLDGFHGEFSALLQEARAAEDGMRRTPAIESPVACPTCGRAMKLRIGKSGMFLGCSGYDLPEAERCRQTLSLDLIDVPQTESEQVPARESCAICGAPMDVMRAGNVGTLHVCARRPACAGMRFEEGHLAPDPLETSHHECDRCGSALLAKKGRFGPFFACSNPNCGNTRKMLKNGEPAPPRMTPIPMPDLRCDKADDHFVLREGARGLFLAASKYPRHRETRSPKVSEIAGVVDSLPEKLQYLARAPQADPEGNPTDIRYSLKSGPYLASFKGEKQSKWRGFYDDKTSEWGWLEAKAGSARTPARKKASKLDSIR